MAKLRQPLAGESELSDALGRMVREGDLYEKLPANRVHCFACGHRCKINDGGRGICQVRYNRGGKLLVPRGYVAALQSDPIEKKPFYHVLPSADALTFGMLGCDLHCAYCFTGDVVVITDGGSMSFAALFELAERFEQRAGAEIAYPQNLRTVAASGQWRKVEAVFKHPYRGKLAVLEPYYLPELRCTPDHYVYATDDPNCAPQLTRAQALTKKHYLATPRQYAFSAARVTDAAQELGNHVERRVIETEGYYLSPLRSVTSADHDGAVYNMQVAEEHNYLANLFLVSNCQNWDISQALRDANAGRLPTRIEPQQIVALGKRYGAKAIVSSYNEPLITSEWAVEIFKEAKAHGFLCAYVSNGNATREVLEYLRPYLSAYKIDLKTMRDKNYRQLGAPLQNILDGVKLAHALGFWVEIVTLVVPGLNDSTEELMDAAQFIRTVSPDIPWHVTAFHQDYKLLDHDNTSAATLIRACEIGVEAGLNYVYAGNIPGHAGEWENTYCPNCRALLVERYGYMIGDYRITGDGACPKCGTKIPGIWHTNPRAAQLGSRADWFLRRPRAVQ